jgi:hypothetical protein
MKATARAWTKRVEQKPSTVIRRQRRRSLFQPCRHRVDFFSEALYSRIVCRRTIPSFLPAIGGQAKTFAADKRAEMRRAAFQAGADVLRHQLIFLQEIQGVHNE